MWLPFLLKQLNSTDMQTRGLQIPVDSIYAVNKSSLKDGVVLFGGGCTGEIISDKGLLLTNHHCGYGQIQSHSTVKKDYLTDGYWAKTYNDELPCKGLTASFIIRIDDVTNDIIPALNSKMTEAEREATISTIAYSLEKKAVEGTHYEARVRPFFTGNKYFMIVSETYKDVRLVGTPPSAIGKFGADADNWMWPRHTGDFALF
ncbi:MAG: S46 family peptidase [Bacteroidetes bacterium]|nr:S46 family peptidase [Bacteroidota bacterium]